MGIRVEYGPSAASLGRLAYETGVGQYENKRRSELEALAMQQAEMRQKAMMQQQSLLASLRGQQMSHMSAMQRLQAGQYYGQINSQQAHQRSLQLAEDAREHSLNLAEVHNEDTIERTKLRMGMENQQAWEQASFKLEMTNGYDNLNAAGKQAKMQGLQELAELYNDPKLNPQERPQYIQQKKAELRQINENPLYHIGKDQQIGFIRKVGRMRDGNHMWNEERVGTRGTPDDWRKTPNLIRVDARGAKSEITMAQWLAGTKHIYEVNGQPWMSRADVNGNWIDEPVDTSREDLARRELQAEKRQHELDVRKMWHGLDETTRGTIYKDQTFDDFRREHPFDIDQPSEGAIRGGQQIQRPAQETHIPLRTVFPSRVGMGEPSAPAVDAPAPPVAPQAPAAPPVAPQAPAAPTATPRRVSKEFETVPVEFHPQKQWGDTPIKSTLEGYKALGRVSIYAIAPEDQQAVYQERQREAKVLPWDSAERGGVSPETIANALKNGPLEYGAKVDLSKDNSPFADAWKKATGQDVLVVNDELMWKLLSPNLTEEQQAELQQQIYTQKKEHFEYYGEPGDFPSANVQRFQQRVQGIQ
jgi:hypothetical protein